MPRVQFINRSFPPVPGATGALLAELAPELVARGWDVDIVAGRAGEETRATGVTVRRVGSGHRGGSGRAPVWRRGLGFLGFYPRALRAALRHPRPDVYVIKTDPPLLAALGPVLRRRTGAPIIHWAQDVYPDVAEALNVLRPGGVVSRVARRVVRRALPQYDAVVSVGRCMEDRLRAHGVAGDRLRTVSNWALGSIRPVNTSNPFRVRHGLGDAFVVMYSGNLGMAHPFDAFIDAAEVLSRSHGDVAFVIVGDGARKAWVEAEIARRGLGSVTLLPFQPQEGLAESLSAADLHLITMEPELIGAVVPSKLYGVLAAGRPALFVGPAGSEAARALVEAEAGEVVAPDGRALVEAISRWKSDAEAHARACVNARAATRRASDAADAFDSLLREVVAAQ